MAKTVRGRSLGSGNSERKDSGDRNFAEQFRSFFGWWRAGRSVGHWFARASAAANVTPWGQGGRRLHHRHLFSRSSGGWKPKIQVESSFVSSEASLLGGVQMAGHLHPALSRGLPSVPAPSAVSVRLLMRTPVGLTEGPP